VPDELISTHERKHVPACLKAKPQVGEIESHFHFGLLKGLKQIPEN